MTTARISLLTDSRLRHGQWIHQQYQQQLQRVQAQRSCQSCERESEQRSVQDEHDVVVVTGKTQDDERAEEVRPRC